MRNCQNIMSKDYLVTALVSILSINFDVGLSPSLPVINVKIAPAINADITIFVAIPVLHNKI